MKKNFDMSGIQPKLREILEELDGRIPAAGMKQQKGIEAQKLFTEFLRFFIAYDLRGFSDVTWSCVGISSMQMLTPVASARWKAVPKCTSPRWVWSALENTRSACSQIGRAHV